MTEPNKETYERVSLIIRPISLIFGVILFIGGILLIYWDLMAGQISTKHDARIALLLFGVFIFISLFGLNLIFQTFSRSTISLQKYYRSNFAKISNGVVNLIFIGLFLTALIYLLIILIQPEVIFTQTDEKVRFNAQVLVSVCLGGFLGGFVRETYSRFLISKEELTTVFIDKFWIIIFSLLGSVLLSIIFFLLLRAGILKSETVDSFNLYGVSGISTVTGYLSDRVIKRISVLYETLFETKGNMNKEETKKTDDNNT